jgi:hypothetical protein
MSTRDQHGRFQLGNTKGRGRPSRAVEHRYLRALSTVVPLREWKEIGKRAVHDAKNGNAAAREWLSRHLIGDNPLVLADMIAQMRSELERIRHAHPNGTPRGEAPLGGSQAANAGETE